MARPDVILLIAAFAALAPAQAEQPARTPDELKVIEGEIADTEKQQAESAAERERVAAELETLSAEGRSLAADIQALERELTRTEARIAPLATREGELTASLGERRTRIAPLLGALQRLTRDAPPALATTPDDAVGAARGAMLMASVAEKLKAEATALAGELAELSRTRLALIAERDAAKTREATLTARRGELDAVIARRQSAIAALDTGLAEAEERLKSLKARGADMAALMDWVDENAPAAAPGAATNGPVTVARGKALAFARRKGDIAWPAAGLVAGRFGETAANGTPALGLTLRTRGHAQVTAPADGEIVFADTFAGYGRLLILSPGEGYFILIGGLGRLDAVAGQHVLAGEPLGAMAEPSAGGEALMYIELRQAGKPVDPFPWFQPDANG